MIEFLSREDIVALHYDLIEAIGGSHGLRDEGGLQLALSQPNQTFGGEDLYPGVLQKAATLGYGLMANHPFVDGNKRIEYVALRTFLNLNGYELAGRRMSRKR